MENKKIMVERETYEKDGKSYFAYYVKGEIKGKEVRIGIKPPDFGGYAVLDIVFEGASEAELVVTPYKMTTTDGQTIEGNTFTVVSYDEDGEIYECSVKPNRPSDKSLMKMLVR
jgi:hypothetical protein